MSVTSATRLDWRGQFSALAPYIEGRGGVVHVHAEPDAPIAVFAKVLRQELRQIAGPLLWTSAQVDPLNADTHYVWDIALRIGRAVDVPINLVPQGAANVTVGSDLTARRGDVTISNVSVVVQSSSFETPIREAALVQRLCETLRGVLKTRRLALVFVDMHEADRQSLNRIYSNLWENGLERLVDDGLLVVDIFRPQALEAVGSSWPPDPNVVLSLSATFDNESGRHALDDLIELALDEHLFPSRIEARAFAMTLLTSSRNIREVHARLGLALTGLRALDG